mmetsp:Transcript_3257/g.14121  ORF Transcript_3257/g.14121 Transcript_3257/m.14121 type:complete len:217 (+) Transcript_3257:9633-10283(+)
MKLVFSFFMAHAASQSIAIVAMLQLRMTLPHLQAAIAVHLMCEPFYSKGQQSLETFSLFAAAIMYHLGIMQKTAGNDSQLSIRSLILLVQFFLNGGILWAFIRFLFKATILETIETKVSSDKEKIQNENVSRERFIHREVIEFHPRARALLPSSLNKPSIESRGVRSRDRIIDAEVPDLWMKHLRLSVNLEMLRDSWQHARGNVRSKSTIYNPRHS